MFSSILNLSLVFNDAMVSIIENKREKNDLCEKDFAEALKVIAHYIGNDSAFQNFDKFFTGNNTVFLDYDINDCSSFLLIQQKDELSEETLETKLDIFVTKKDLELFIKLFLIKTREAKYMYIPVSLKDKNQKSSAPSPTLTLTPPLTPHHL